MTTTRFALAFLAATFVSIAPASAQYGGYGGRMGMDRAPQAPKLPGVELTGPLDTALARVMLSLTPDQATRYAQVYDSFMVATRPQRDSATAAIDKMNDRLEAGDRAAAMLYVDRAQELGKTLRDRQDRFESNLRRIFTGDQIKAYKKWHDGEDANAERKRRDDAVKWAEAGFRGEMAARGPSTGDIKTALITASGTASPELGSQSVRVGRTLYVAGQLGVDSAGTLAGADLRTQALRAFVNLSAVLQAAGANSRDVMELTIYVVNYRPADVATIREAGAAYFGSNAPVVNVLGVQALAHDGALIAVSATANARY